MQNTVTYSEPSIADYINDYLVPLKLVLSEREHSRWFRQYGVIWTPTVGFLDRNGTMHYRTDGFLPPLEFSAALRIGRSRCLMTWTRCGEAIAELEEAAALGSSHGAEALFWLAAARFLERRDTSGMWETWAQLATTYPDSPWARRVYPRSD